MALFVDCFTDDAAGDFNPMGIIEGRHAIVSTFKEFRRPWPWMQHFADVLKISVNEAEGTAKMIVGRIIPERSHLSDGTPLYGAHYRMRLRRQREGFWQITWSEYNPGWLVPMMLQNSNVEAITCKNQQALGVRCRLLC